MLIFARKDGERALFMKSIKPRVIIRWLRHASLIMIALPEPITTVMGVVLLSFTFYLSHAFSRIIEKSLNAQARERLSNYFAHFKRFGDGEIVPAEVQEKPQSGRNFFVQQPDASNAKVDLGSALSQGLSGERISSHHSINISSLAMRYGIGNDLPSGVLRTGYSASDEDAIHHSIRREYLTRRFVDSENVVPVFRATGDSVYALRLSQAARMNLNSLAYTRPDDQNDSPGEIRHSVNMALLRKRFSPEVSKSSLKVYREDFDLLNVYSSL